MGNTSRELFISAVRSIFSAVPFAGQALNEIVFEFNGRIKQERLNKFTNLLSDYFIEHQSINLEDLKSEDFSDLLESVIRKTVLTKSDFKMKRFRDILVTKMENPKVEDDADIYVELVSSLSETEIKILYFHSYYAENAFNETMESLECQDKIRRLKDELEKEKILFEKGFANNKSWIATELTQNEIRFLELNEKLTEFKKYKESNFYEINDDRFLYYKQNLASRGLLIDKLVGAMDYNPYEDMEITKFGKDFISFVVRPDNSDPSAMIRVSTSCDGSI